LYTGVKNRLGETVQKDKTRFDTEISQKQDQFISDMLAQGKKKEDIFSALDSLKAE
jgi:DNA-binding transcriptional regulator YhcF (GntR family)